MWKGLVKVICKRINYVFLGLIFKIKISSYSSFPLPLPTLLKIFFFLSLLLFQLYFSLCLFSLYFHCYLSTNQLSHSVAYFIKPFDYSFRSHFSELKLIEFRLLITVFTRFIKSFVLKREWRLHLLIWKSSNNFLKCFIRSIIFNHRIHLKFRRLPARLISMVIHLL